MPADAAQNTSLSTCQKAQGHPPPLPLAARQNSSIFFSLYPDLKTISVRNARDYASCAGCRYYREFCLLCSSAYPRSS
ncbi:hypothetical protein LMH87_011306 [Akanthomyces muscarius]|uniref:Uncharacterized protein n=1 Tax=Akanthomyces muscarius TaxID=2231603 RepID=A0A9W8UKU8_AKAMU|nr:hypothetical protein LMH87_011306 [Akanthomyces muscarius]KAJ4150561.1 hypothetical protein LMH87_011306 [Akanthomyces muscarius]